MGGNAFKAIGYVSERMDLQTFKCVQSEIHTFLHDLSIEFLDIAYVQDKTDFGDLDILVVEQQHDVFELILKSLTTLPCGQQLIDLNLIFRNGLCLSILYKGLYQIDFIKTHEEYKQYHQKYLSYNDLGNLIGRCVKEAQYKHGHDGFFYTYYDGTRIKKDILISRDYREVLNLLGLSVAKFDEGFANVNEMFAYVVSNRYFKASFYQLENLNHTNRVRDAKRNNYKLFLKYIAQLQKDDAHVPALPSYQVCYPHIEQHIEALKQQSLLYRQQKQKINGEIVKNITGLEGKALGDFIQKFKYKYPEHVLALHTKAQIEQLIQQEIATSTNH